jgi:lysophospholipase L1-like esterase
MQMTSNTFKAIAVIVVWSATKLAISPTVVCAEPTTKKAADAKKPATKPAPNLGAFFKQHWANRVKLFREENQQIAERRGRAKNVVLLGDSITEGFKVATYFPDRHVLNRGISADVIGNALPKTDNRGILRRMDESIFDCSPRDVFILIGINDLGSGHKPEAIEAGYREILEKVKKRMPGVRVHIQSVLPTRGNYAKHNKNVIDTNDRLKKLAKEFDYDYIDLHSKMTDEKGELKKEFTADGLHLKDPGYKVWKAEIDRAMKW